MLNDVQRSWIASVVKSHVASTMPAGSIASPTAAADADQAMAADCKPVHGKVPGPQNHLLCGAHGHILDVKAKTVIAKDLNDYVIRFPRPGTHSPAPSVGGAVLHTGPKPPGNAPPSAPASASAKGGMVGDLMDGLSNASNVASDLLTAGAKRLADAPPKDPWAGTPSPTRAHDIETGKSLATAKAKQYVTEKYARVTSAMIRWQNEQTQILRKEDAEGGGFVATLLKITKIVETGIALAFPEIEAVKVITEVASFTTEVAATSNEISEDAAKKAKAKASAAVLDQISGVVNDVLAKQTYFEIQADKTIKAALPKLDGDPKIADRLASNNDADIEYVVTKVLNVKDTQSAGNDIAHMLIQMDKEMAAYLKKAAVDEKMSRIGPLFKAGEMGDSMRKRLEDEYDDDHANDE